MSLSAAAPGLRVLLAVPWYFPDSVGGTEVYVRGLAAQLREAGVDVAIAVPNGDAAEYVYDGIRVFPFAAPYGASGEIDLHREDPAEWGELLDRFSPMVVDFHCLTSGLELAHVRSARARGARTVVTLHIPGVICARGTLMRFGEAACSGDIACEPCTACRLQAQGVPPPIGHLLGRIPATVAHALDAPGVPPTARRAVTAALRDSDRREWLRAIFDHADRIVAPSAWLVEVIIRNGASPDKVALCRQGVDLTRAAVTPRRSSGGSLNIGFIGRFDPVKGLHILIDALRRIPPDVGVAVHVWGVARSSEEHAYRQAMIQKAAGDSRIRFQGEIADPAEALANIDVLAVPSVWLETGPLVVLEAQAAGIPVVGSNLGGIAERVTDGQDGVLVPAGDAVALGRALCDLAQNPDRLRALRPQTATRGLIDVGVDTLRMYTALLGVHAN